MALDGGARPSIESYSDVIAKPGTCRISLKPNASESLSLRLPIFAPPSPHVNLRPKTAHR